MGREKKQDEVKPGLPGWFATYSDLVTLLLTFFVLMMSMANFEDVQRVTAVFASLRAALGVDGTDFKLVQSMVSSDLTENVRRQETVQPVFAKLREAMSKHVSDDLMRITQTPTELRLRLDDRVFFQPGKTDVHPSAFQILGEVADAIKDEPIEVRVEGHTDARGDEAKNWGISSERAIAVLMALRARGVPGHRVSAVAFGSFRPGAIIGEDDPWNRRVELVIRSDHVGAAAAAEGLMGDGGR